ncbi:MAG: DUF4139 domain-containing protein, partial [Candidatus Zipacnadales bacterium]
MRCRYRFFGNIVIWGLSSVLAHAEISVTLCPPRHNVSLVIYGNADLTLVREFRQLFLGAEPTEVALEWPGAAVDLSSVRLHVPEGVTVHHARQPRGTGDQLCWLLKAETPGIHELEITYFTSGIEWNPQYRLTINEGTGAVEIEGVVTLRNRSGQEFQDAEISLLVGEVRLLENLAEASWKQLPAYKDEKKGPPSTAGSGLSETYVYSLGRLPELPLADTITVPFLQRTSIRGAELVCRAHQAKYADGVHQLLIFANNAVSGLGSVPLTRAPAQVYRVGAKGLLPHRSVVVPYTPANEECEIDLGPNPDIVVQRRVINRQKTNFEFGRFEEVEGFDEREWIEVELTNHSLHPVTIEYTDTVPGVWEIIAEKAVLEEGFNEATFRVELAPQTTETLAYRLIKRQGKRVSLW